jgi:hypothetical protein
VIFLLGDKDAPPRGKLKLPYCGLRGLRTATVCLFKTARRGIDCATMAADNKMQSATLAHRIVLIAVSASLSEMKEAPGHSTITPDTQGLPRVAVAQKRFGACEHRTSRAPPRH